MLPRKWLIYPVDRIISSEDFPSIDAKYTCIHDPHTLRQEQMRRRSQSDTSALTRLRSH